MNNGGMPGGGGGGMARMRSLNNGRPEEKIDPKAKSKVLRRLGKYVFVHKWYVLLAFCLMLVSNLLALVAPKLSGKAIDAIKPGQGAVDIQSVIFYCVLLLIFYAVSSAMSYVLAITMVKLSQKIIYTMRRQLFNRLTELPVGYFDTHATGDIISHISYDVDTVNASLSHDLLQICTSIITVVGSLVMMISISPALILVFAVTVPVSIIFTRYKTKKIRPLFKKRSMKLGMLNGYAEEMLSGQRSIKVYGREDVITGRFDDRNKDAVDAYYDADYHGAIIGPGVNGTCHHTRRHMLYVFD